MPTKIELTETEGRRCLDLIDRKLDISLRVGIEIGTLETFFSFESNKNGTSREKDSRLQVSEDSWDFSSEVSYDTARIRVAEKSSINNTGGRRVLNVRAVTSSLLMDCVLRFVIPKNQVLRASIGQKNIPHLRRNHYHQFPASPISLDLRSGVSITFAPRNSNLPDGFEHLAYLRDEPEYWVIHFRALATAPTVYTIKGCSRFYNRPFPLAFQRFISAFPKLRENLLFVRERVSQRIPFQVNGASELKAGQDLELGVDWVVSK